MIPVWTPYLAVGVLAAWTMIVAVANGMHLLRPLTLRRLCLPAVLASYANIVYMALHVRPLPSFGSLICLVQLVILFCLTRAWSDAGYEARKGRPVNSPPG